MTTALDPKVKKQNAEKRKEETIRKNRIILLAFFKKHGTVKKVAKALNISTSAIYEQMNNAGIDTDYGYLEGEPKDTKKRKQWFENLLKKNTVPQLAKLLKTSQSSIRARINKLGIQRVLNKNKERTILETLLEVHGSVNKAAKALDISPEAYTAKMELVGLKNGKAKAKKK